MGDRLSIGAVANQAGVTPDTIRYDERLGVLATPASTPAGYRQYPGSIVTRLALIRNAQQFGFSLRDIASFLSVRDSGGRPCHDVRQAAERRLSAVDRQIAELVTRRDHMQRTLRLWDQKLAGIGAERRAYLLETPGPGDRPRRKVRGRRSNPR